MKIDKFLLVKDFRFQHSLRFQEDFIGGVQDFMLVVDPSTLNINIHWCTCEGATT